MLFNSLQFLVFFLVVFGVYVLLRHRAQNLFLLVASYVFYGAWDYRFLSLLIATTVVDYYVGLALHRETREQRRKRILVVSIVANLGVLGLFKYFNFFTESLVELTAALGFQLSPLTLKIILPVGVSFYTFQSMSYTIDVYRRQLEPCRRLLDFSLYVAFFPQLVAGPIERATTLLPQILAPRQVTLEKIGSGLPLIIVGFYKKMVLADNLAPTVNAIFSQQSYTAGEVIAGALLFAFQIYGDFSGYSDIARGTARLLGFELMVNFREPYFARSPSDFWRRWHISLSTWLRDYLYISLGGNQGTRLQTYRNLMLTMVLGGLWHGAAWNFVLWGMFHGTLLVGYRLYDESFGRAGTRNDARSGVVAASLQTLIMFAFTLYSWLLFRATSGTQIVEMTTALAHGGSMDLLVHHTVRLLLFAWPVLLLDYLNFRSREAESVITAAPMLLQTLGYSVLLLMFIMLGKYESASFIYFQF